MPRKRREIRREVANTDSKVGIEARKISRDMLAVEVELND